MCVLPFFPEVHLFRPCVLEQLNSVLLYASHRRCLVIISRGATVGLEGWSTIFIFGFGERELPEQSIVVIYSLLSARSYKQAPSVACSLQLRRRRGDDDT